MHNLSLNTVVPPEQDGCRLDQVLARLFPQYSRSYLQRHIKNYRVQVDSKSAQKSSLCVFPGQHIQLELIPDPIENPWKGDGSIPLKIIHEDEALLIINKTAGLVTHPAPGHVQDTLVNALLHYIPDLAQLPRAGIIHRLDKDTSGLLVIPKTLTAHTYLVRELEKRKIMRIYTTIVKGHFTTSGTINAPIGRHPTLRQKQAVVLNGKPAITHYSIVERFQHHTLLKVTLETGRTHQIRVHMNHLKHPILGDTVYGSRTKQLNYAFTRQALHAHRLGLQHPLTHQFCVWQAPLPEDMQTLLIQLREEVKNNNID